MIPAATLDPAMNIARLKGRTARVDTSRNGMLGVLQDWRTNSPRFGANRKADGLTQIDAMCAMLLLNWHPQGGAGAANEGAATQMLDACAHWLANHRIFGARVAGWREQSIQDLYWQVAWAYTSDYFVQRALNRIAVNHAANIPTTMLDPMPVGTPGGNPFQFGGSGYAHHPVSALGPLYRGDTRSPQTILASEGFRPRNRLNRWAFEPFFDGSNTGDTPGFTVDPALAIGAGPAALATGNPRDAGMDAWMATLGNGGSRGFVYELGNLPPATMCTRAEEQHVGREVIFLDLPETMITRWWVVHGNRTTSGPFLFPAPAVPVLPAGVPSAPNVLA